jgi:hypothetical protein
MNAEALAAAQRSESWLSRHPEARDVDYRVQIEERFDADLDGLRDARCPRCGGARAETGWCTDCGLYLTPGPQSGPSAVSIAARARSEAWVRAHPADAHRDYSDDVAALFADATAPVASDAPYNATNGAIDGSRRDNALAALEYWHARATFLSHLAEEAKERAKDAYSESLEAGVTHEEMATLSRGLPFVPATSHPADSGSSRERGGGFLFGFYESGPDMDFDGDVDGGIVDSVAGFLGDLF